MNKFEFVRNDKRIIDIYNKISEYENKDVNGWAHHDLNHVSNVAFLVERILQDLNYNETFIEEAKIAALLHDIGCLRGKDGHPTRGYEFSKKYLKENNIKLENENFVLEAIKIHSDGFDTDNIIALVLMLSDKLDIKYTRVAHAGYNVKGMRQLQHIQDIEIKIENKVLSISFKCDEFIDREELEEFYFIKKVFKAIYSFTNKMSLTPLVLLNEDLWELRN